MPEVRVAEVKVNAVALLQERVRAHLRFKKFLRDKVVRECRLHGVPYKGTCSWPERLRLWSKVKNAELIAFAKKYGLCRVDIKKAMLEIERSVNKDNDE